VAFHHARAGVILLSTDGVDGPLSASRCSAASRRSLLTAGRVGGNEGNGDEWPALSGHSFRDIAELILVEGDDYGNAKVPGLTSDGCSRRGRVGKPRITRNSYASAKR